MPEVIAALIGASATAVLMTAMNNQNIKEKQLIEIFRRLNAIEQELASLNPPQRRQDWRNR